MLDESQARRHRVRRIWRKIRYLLKITRTAELILKLEENEYNQKIIL